jgi:mannobiose 2-epimerase
LQSKDLCSEFEAELISILNWWIENMVDESSGGFFGRIDGHGKLFTESPKSVILNTRILWTFSAAAKTTHREVDREIADRAFDYMRHHFVDTEQGGLYWMLDFRGRPINNRKQIYAQAFAIYAFAEYYLLTGNNEAKKLAYALFEIIQKISYDPAEGGYFEAFDRSWNTIEDVRLSEKDANEAKTMNTHLHILESYTNLYKIDQNETVGQALESLIRIFLNRFINKDTFHLHLFFNENWDLKSDVISYGHDIEFSWLIVEAASALGNKSLLKEVEEASVKMAQCALEEGVDQDGALINENHPTDSMDSDKHWWPQAEAVVGFWNIWELTGNEKFRKAAVDCWQFIKKFLKYPDDNEWYWRVNREGIPILSEDKAGPWKAPYHNGRMCIEMLHRLGKAPEK